MAVMLSEATFIWCHDDTELLYFPFFAPLGAGEATYARVTLEVRQANGGFNAQPYAEWSFDGTTWERNTSSALLGSSRSTDGISYPTAGSPYGWEAIPVPTWGKRRWVRFGVASWNTSSDTFGSGYATLRVETKTLA